MPFLKEIILMRYLEQDIIRLVTDNSIDIIHAHSPILCGLPALRVAKKMRIPFIYEVRALWEDAAVDQQKTKEGSLRYKLTRWLETKLLKQADVIITICKGLKKEIVERNIREDKVHIVHNGVDVNKFVPCAKDTVLLKKYNLNGHIVIGFIGSFYKFEGLEILLRSVPNILANSKNVKFLIVGGGEEENDLKQLARTLHIEKDVIFTGRVPHTEIFKYYSIIDIFAYPRVNKRITNLVTPLKPLEAMSMGKAIIGSDVGGLRELINDKETGLLFKAESIGDLVDKCVYLLRNREKRESLGQKARVEMIQRRDWAKIVSEYVNIYDNLLSRGIR